MEEPFFYTDKAKPSHFILLAIIMLLPAVSYYSCKKDLYGFRPVVETTPVTEIGYTNALSGGKVVDDQEYPIEERGVCWCTEKRAPTINDQTTHDGNGLGIFTSSIENLEFYTTYYIRAYATSKAGTGYGNTLIFKTLPVTDVDGNIYRAITIGDQVWMVDNLSTQNYNDGSPILGSQGRWSWYDDDSATYNNIYGKLYDWFAVNSGKLCPDGWKVPSDSDWIVLTDYLGGFEVAGGKLKEKGTEHWINPNLGATDEVGFAARPGGYYRVETGPPIVYHFIHESANFWTSSELTGTNEAYYRYMFHSSVALTRIQGFKGDRFSVRCNMQ